MASDGGLLGGGGYQSIANEPGSPIGNAQSAAQAAGRETAREVRLDVLNPDGIAKDPVPEAQHRPLCHSWALGAVSLTVLLVVTGGVVALCLSALGPPPPSRSLFRKVSSGTCLSNGLHVIEDMATCEAAAAALGLNDRTAEESPSGIVGPEGCYYLTRTSPIHIETLWLNRNSDGSGRGAESSNASMGLFREPICMVQKSLPREMQQQGPAVPAPIMPAATQALPGLPGGVGGLFWGTTTTTFTVTDTTTYTGTSTTTTTSETSTTKTTTSTTSITTTTLTTTTSTSTFTTTYHTVPTLFCYSVMRVKSYEFSNIRTQLGLNTSIFACNDHLLFSDKEMTLTGGIPRPGLPYLEDVPNSRVVKTVLLRHDLTTKPKEGALEGILNTQIFMQAWRQVSEDGRFRHHDWTVKVDPDAVFLPSRLQAHVAELAPASTSVKMYLINCKQSFGLFGALEVFSRDALETYIQDQQLGEESTCKKVLDWTMMGEDLWMRRCLDVLDITHKNDFGLLSDGYCNDAPSPCVSGKVTFHPFKTSLGYAHCYQQAITPTTTTTTSTTSSTTSTKTEEEKEEKSSHGNLRSAATPDSLALPSLAPLPGISSDGTYAGLEQASVWKQ